MECWRSTRSKRQIARASDVARTTRSDGAIAQTDSFLASQTALSRSQKPRRGSSGDLSYLQDLPASAVSALRRDCIARCCRRPVARVAWVVWSLTAGAAHAALFVASDPRPASRAHAERFSMSCAAETIQMFEPNSARRARRPISSGQDASTADG
jgi:hypothetical protein